MATVVVTGGAGKLGRACVKDLVEHGWQVVVFDRARTDTGVIQVPVDLTDYGQVIDAMLGVEERYERVDAVVHLAAVPAPGIVGDHATFTNNMNATWNVVSAARRADITKIVWASSETVLGLPFDTPPPYVPVDEDYPPRPESTYSLVKTMEETMAAQLCRRDPSLSMIGLRFSNVMYPHDYERFADFQDGTSTTVLVVEAGQPVEWTKPDDLDGSPGKPFPPLGGQRLAPQKFQALMADGTVKLLNLNMPETTLRALVTHSGNEALPAGWDQ